MAQSPNSVSHPNFSPYADRSFGRNNENWLNLRQYDPEPVVLSPWNDVIFLKLVAGRRWVFNYVIFGWPDDDEADVYHKLVAHGPVDTYNKRNPSNKTLTDGITAYEFSPCAPITLSGPLRWDVLSRVNNITWISVIVWD